MLKNGPVRKREHKLVVSQQVPGDEMPMIVDQPRRDPEEAEDSIEGKWKDGLCDWHTQCFPSCCLATWCPCIILGQMYEDLNHGKCTYVAGAVIVGVLVYSALAKWIPQAAQATSSVFIFSLFILTFALRAILRKRQDIEGSDLRDCWVSLWCTCCTIAQMARQLYHYQSKWEACPLTFDGRPERPALDLRPSHRNLQISDSIEEV